MLESKSDTMPTLRYWTRPTDYKRLRLLLSLSMLLNALCHTRSVLLYSRSVPDFFNHLRSSKLVGH